MSLRLILWKDLRQEARSREALQAGLVLVALFFLVDMFAVEQLQDAPRLAAIVLWTPLIYATAAVVGRGMAREADRGTLELARTTPVPLAYHGISRTLVDLLLVAVITGATLLGAWAIFDVPLRLELILVLSLGALGVTVVGSLAGGLAAQTRAREVLLPLLMLPVLAPLILSGVRGTLAALNGTDLGPVLLLLAGYDLIAIGITWWLWPHVLEAD